MIFMLVCAMLTAVAIVREKETGTMELLLASPIRPFLIILAKIVPYFTLSILNLATILALSVSVLEMPIAGSLGALVGISLLFICVALAFGLLVSNLVETQAAAMLISAVGMMAPTMILSGMIFPVESMPRILQWLSVAMPPRWYIAAVSKLMVQGVPVFYVRQEFFILLAMLAVLLAASLKSFRVRLKK
jgi:ABC-2 type transport system permease protein